MRTRRSSRRLGPAMAGAVFAAGLAAGLGAPVGSARADTIRAAAPFPIRGVATTVFVEVSPGHPAVGAQVCAVYRPGSETALPEAVGVTDSLGRVAWTPECPGIACLAATRSDSAGTHVSELNVSIRFDRVPPEGIAIAILAGFILYGAVAYGFGKMRS